MLKNFQTRSHSLGCSFSVLLFITTSFTPVNLEGHCSVGWTESLSSQTCIKVVNKSLTWGSARTYCQHHNGDLVMILNQQMHELIIQVITTFSNETAAFSNETVDAFWIGLNDLRTEAEFRWLDTDDELQYENWMPGHLSSGDQGDCGQIRLLPQIQERPAWVDTQCNADALPICERLVGALECSESYYGPDCWRNCSPNCAGLFNFCDPISGACTSGCRPGYIGDKCETECSDNEYGLNCLLECSENCFGSYNVCDHQHGTCLFGCREGFSGEKCDKECSKNTYGRNCSLRCSQNCAGVTNICDQRNGSCNFGCTYGYSGEYCSIVAEKSRSSTWWLVYLTAGLFFALVFIVLLFIEHERAMKQKTASRAALRAASGEAPETAAGTASGAVSGTASLAVSGTASGATSESASSATSREVKIIGVVSRFDLLGLPQTRILNSRFTNLNSVSDTSRLGSRIP